MDKLGSDQDAVKKYWKWMENHPEMWTGEIWPDDDLPDIHLTDEEKKRIHLNFLRMIRENK